MRREKKGRVKDASSFRWSNQRTTSFTEIGELEGMRFEEVRSRAQFGSVKFALPVCHSSLTSGTGTGMRGLWS